MLNLKSVIGASLFAVSAMAASSAFAYGPANGSYVAGPGATTLSYLGNNVPCTSTFTIYTNGVSGDAASVIGASFASGTGGSALCPHITATASPTSPWTLTPATLVSTGVYTATIIGVSVYVPAPINATCTGSVTVTLNQTASPSVASFSGTLHNGAIPCGVSGTGLLTAITAP